MKKLFAVAASVIMMLSTFSACAPGKTVTGNLDPTGLTQSDYDALKQSVIDTFGVSIDNSSIVGFRTPDEHYLEYIVVTYKDGKKDSEATYYFYYNKDYYNSALREYGKKDHVIADENEAYIKIASNNANTGSYASDFEKLDADYMLKTSFGTQ